MTITLRPHQQRGNDRMDEHNKGQLIFPTGAGKTLTAIMDAKKVFDTATSHKTIVVVAPRILLAEQLCSEFLEVIQRKDLHVMHVHSGETSFFSTTKVKQIQMHDSVCKTAGEHPQDDSESCK